MILSKTAVSLLYDEYLHLQRRVEEVGSKRVKCPSCKRNRIVQDLAQCESGCTCCVDCAQYAEDSTLCTKCVNALNKELERKIK